MGFVKAFIKVDYAWIAPGLKAAAVRLGVAGFIGMFIKSLLSRPKKPSQPQPNIPWPPITCVPPIVVKSFATRVFDTVRYQLRNLPTSVYYMSHARDCFVRGDWCSCHDKPCDHDTTVHIEIASGSSLQEKLSQISQKLKYSNCRLLFVSALQGGTFIKQVLEACCSDSDDSCIQHRILLVSRSAIENHSSWFVEKVGQLRKNRWLILVTPDQSRMNESWSHQDNFPGFKPDAFVTDLYSPSSLSLAYVAPVYHEPVDALSDARGFEKTVVASSLFLNLPKAGACRYTYGDGSLEFS